MLKQWFNEVQLNLKMQLRVPISVFFSLIFPLLMMCLILLSFKNVAIGQGYHFIDCYLPIGIGIGIGLIPLTVVSFPMDLGSSLEKHVFKQLKYLNVDLNRYLTAKITAYLVLSLASILIDLCFATLFFHAHWPHFSYFLSFIAEFEYCVVVNLILGALLALSIQNTKILLPIGMIFTFTFFALSGTFVQYNQLAPSIQRIGQYLPWKYVMNNGFQIWNMTQYWNSTFLKLNTVWLFVLGLLLSLLGYHRFKK